MRLLLLSPVLAQARSAGVTTSTDPGAAGVRLNRQVKPLVNKANTARIQAWVRSNWNRGDVVTLSIEVV